MRGGGGGEGRGGEMRGGGEVRGGRGGEKLRGEGEKEESSSG